MTILPCRRLLSARRRDFRSVCHHSTLAKDTPLRVLFCGSDDFSAASLKELHKEHSRNPDLIESIDVVCRAGKPAGRGLKTIREVPIKSVAESLDLPVHDIPTFTGWSPPQSNGRAPNIVIAVSFGLLVPPRILGSAQYGGLNVHPSLLPDLRGPAPLQHALMQGRNITGVSVQTLHPKHFDEGVLLSQAEFSIPHYGFCSYAELLSRASREGAKLLLETLRKRLYLTPTAMKPLERSAELSHAPKITAENSHIDIATWDPDRILRLQRVLGPLWADFHCLEQDPQPLRIQFHNLRPATDLFEMHVAGGDYESLQAKTGVLEQTPDGKYILLWTKDGTPLCPEAVTIEGVKINEDQDLSKSIMRLKRVQLKRQTSGESFTGQWRVS